MLDEESMKSLMTFLFSLLEDIENKTGVCLSRDRKTISDRVEHEGLSFLTISLPSFCQQFEHCLSEERVTTTDFPGFKKRGRSGLLPAFLQGLVNSVFDDDGFLCKEPCIDSILSIRQLCLVFKKVSLPCSDARERSAINAFLLIENELEILEKSSSIPLGFEATSQYIWSRVLSNVEHVAYHSDFVPSHGPGGNADRIVANAKYRFKYWHQRLDRSFPMERFVIANESLYQDLDRLKLIEPEQEKPVKVITVPKTLKSPRVIAMEPLVMQYAQQGVLSQIVRAIESNPLTRSIRFTDQSVNKSLALTSSRSGFYATIDLKEASDRVPLYVVERMLSCVPNLFSAMHDCRSTRALVNGDEVVTLRKWASMGSALCFPVMAMVVYTSIVNTLIQKRNMSSARALAYARAHVAVYGDDIVVPSALLHDVIEGLEGVNLRVNRHKTFGTGKFRESCGTDAYDGYDVTPTYIRHLFPSNVTDVSAIVSLTKSCNSFFLKGFWKASDSIRKLLESLIGPLPLGNSVDSGYLCLDTFQRSVSFTRYGGPLQQRLVRGWFVVPKQRKSVLDGNPALLKCLLPGRREPLEDGHLTHAGRPVALSLKQRWTGVR